MSELLTGEQLDRERARVPEWEVVDGERLQRSFAFRDFAGALAFVNRVGELAERRNHHPDISFGWGKATVTLTSHDAGGLTERDLALAEEIDHLPT